MVEFLEYVIIFCIEGRIFEISGHFLNLIFTKNARNFKIQRQIFPLLCQISLRALRFCMCKFHSNHDHATRYKKRWLNLLSKCNTYAFVLFDAQTVEQWSQATFHLKGTCYLKLY